MLCVYIKGEKSEVSQLCLTLCDSMDSSPPGSSIHGIFQARILEWVAIAFSSRFPDAGIKPESPTLQADTLLSRVCLLLGRKVINNLESILKTRDITCQQRPI